MGRRALTVQDIQARVPAGTPVLVLAALKAGATNPLDPARTVGSSSAVVRGTCGHVWTKAVSDIQRGTWHGECEPCLRRPSLESLQAEAPEGLTVLSVAQGSPSRAYCLGSCGHEFDCPAYALKRRQRSACPTCLLGGRGMSLVDRIDLRARPTASGCLEWEGATTSDGYPFLKVDGKNVKTYRAAFECYYERPPRQGFHVHHMCGNRLCVNPLHLSDEPARANAAEMLDRRALTARLSYLEGEVVRLKARETLLLELLEGAATI